MDWGELVPKLLTDFSVYRWHFVGVNGCRSSRPPFLLPVVRAGVRLRA